MRTALTLVWISISTAVSFGAQSSFDARQGAWTISNGWIQAVFQLDSEGHFLTREITDLHSGDRWIAAPDQPRGPIRLLLSNELFDARQQYVIVDQSTSTTAPPGIRQTIVLRNVNATAQFTLDISIYDDQPVLHYGLTYRNLGGVGVRVTAVNLLPWTFDDAAQRYTGLRVNQWAGDSAASFESSQLALELDGTAFDVYSGAHGEHCGWLALRDSDARGLFAGWEFDGRTKAAVRHVSAAKYIDLSASIVDLNHPVGPLSDFQLPSGFIGLFHGDFDEAGYRTQRFAEAVLARPAPEGKTFPYVSWDSWGFQEQIDEQTLRANADVAAAIGVELFVVDLGWAQGIGNWYADPAKFPSGLRALSDYVHSLGLKFGLHFALAEAGQNSPVLQANPDWASSENESYFGSVSLCLSHQPVKEWLIEQGIRMIDDYDIDWILQDGENMVKTCTKTTHTHDPADSNYSNATDGLNAVVSGIQKARPNVYWENCEDGGNMMTFNMVKNYVTSITNDASGSLQSRRAVYGATYPFPPRYAERYMPETDGINSYATHSYRFGGPWVLMNRLSILTRDQRGFLAREIAKYKAQRDQISSGKVYHIAAPAADVTDAIQSYNEDTDSAIAVITRAQSAAPRYNFRPKGLHPEKRYTVWFEIDPSVFSMSGAQLMNNGVSVRLPVPFSSDVVHIEHQ